MFTKQWIYSNKNRHLCLIIILVLFFIACHTAKNTAKPTKKNTSSVEFYQKYSRKLGVELSGKEDKKFIEAISAWIGTPYVYGGCAKEGTDCSGFVQTLYKDLYHVNLYRTASDLVKNCDIINKKDLKTGDLVFFKINSDKISHVGIYINNDKFIHASSKGVMISDLKEIYYAKYYYASGRVKNLK